MTCDEIINEKNIKYLVDKNINKNKKNIFLKIFTNSDYTDIIGHYVKEFKRVDDLKYDVDLCYKELFYLLPDSKKNSTIEVPNDFEVSHKFSRFINKNIFNDCEGDYIHFNCDDLSFLEAYLNNDKEWIKDFIDTDLCINNDYNKFDCPYYEYNANTGRHNKMKPKDIVNKLLGKFIDNVGDCNNWVRWSLETDNTREKKKCIDYILFNKKYNHKHPKINYKIKKYIFP